MGETAMVKGFMTVFRFKKPISMLRGPVGQ